MKTYTNTNDLYSNENRVDVRAYAGRFVVESTSTYAKYGTFYNVKNENGNRYNVHESVFATEFVEV